MTRVKMNARHEYEYLANYKVLQNVFKVKKIDKVCVIPLSGTSDLSRYSFEQPVPVDKLVKCKMQYVSNIVRRVPLACQHQLRVAAPCLL